LVVSLACTGGSDLDASEPGVGVMEPREVTPVAPPGDVVAVTETPAALPAATPVAPAPRTVSPVVAPAPALEKDVDPTAPAPAVVDKDQPAPVPVPVSPRPDAIGPGQ